MRISALAFALLLPACIVGSGEIEGVGDDQGGGGAGGGGGGGGGGGDGSGSGSGTQATPKITASVDKTTVSTELGKTETLVVTINSVNGFAGPVTLTPTVMDGATAVTGWTTTPTPATVELADGASATVELAVKIPTDTASLAPTVKLDAVGTDVSASVSSAFTVANQLTITIPAGAGTGAVHPGLPAANAPIRLRMGAKVVFHNGDTIAHQIHANGGIPHEGGQLAAGNDYVTTPSDSATWYCHLHEDALNRPILVQ